MFELCSIWLVLGLATLGVDAADAARRRLGPRASSAIERLRHVGDPIRERWRAWRQEALRPPVASLPGAVIHIRRFSLVDYFLPPPAADD